jgi:cytochrome c oxidase subunit II
MAVALRIALILIALGSVVLFIVHPWWFPAGASALAPRLDSEFRITFWLLGALFLAAQILLAMFLVRSRKQTTGAPSRGDWRWETGWTVAITAIFFWFHASSGHLWRAISHTAPASGRVRVEITGAQFQWYFRYPGADNVFGRVDARKFARPDEGNPLGLDPSDPAGRDDVVSSTLVLPVNQPVELDLRAQDVIHSVFIPAMRLKQDAVPGMDIHTSVTPTTTGTYELVCSQLCGLGHYRMRAFVRVVTEEEFKQWLNSRAKAAGSSSPGE